MKKKLLALSLITIVLMAACKKQADQTAATTVLSTTDIKVPTGFTWESYRNITFTVTLIDALFPTKAHVVSIYDGSPANGGNLLAKGTATVATAFKSKVYLSNQVVNIYVATTFQDGSRILQKVPVNKSDVEISVGY